MRIDQDMKLDFKDVLFKPKRSKLESRRDVDMHRTFKFHNSCLLYTSDAADE